MSIEDPDRPCIAVSLSLSEVLLLVLPRLKSTLFVLIDGNNAEELSVGCFVFLFI